MRLKLDESETELYLRIRKGKPDDVFMKAIEYSSKDLTPVEMQICNTFKEIGIVSLDAYGDLELVYNSVFNDIDLTLAVEKSIPVFDKN